MKSLYSLWIVPPPDLKKYLDEIILKLSEKYKSPEFETHMTLLGPINSDKKTMLQKAKKFASETKIFSLEIGEISFSTTYFQSVFIKVKSSAELLEANLKAKKIFQMDNNVFMPHISLIYGNHEMKLREQIASEIELPKNKHFQAENIIVIPCAKNPNDWKHLAKFPLKKSEIK